MGTRAAGSPLTDGDAPLVFPNISCLLIIAWTAAAATSPACFIQLHFTFLVFLSLQLCICLHSQPWLELHRGAPNEEQQEAAARTSHLAPDAVELTAAQVGLLSMEMTHKRLKMYQVNRSAQEAASLTAQGGKLGADKFVRAV